MGLCRNDSRLEIGKVGPGAPVQWQLTDRRGVYRGAQLGRGQLDRGGFRRDLNRLSHLPNLHREIKTLLSTYRQRDAFSQLRAKARRRHTDLVCRGQQVRGCVQSPSTRRNRTRNPGGQICDNHLSVGNERPGRIFHCAGECCSRNLRIRLTGPQNTDGHNNEYPDGRTSRFRK